MHTSPATRRRGNSHNRRPAQAGHARVPRSVTPSSRGRRARNSSRRLVLTARARLPSPRGRQISRTRRHDRNPLHSRTTVEARSHRRRTGVIPGRLPQSEAGQRLRPRKRGPRHRSHRSGHARRRPRSRRRGAARPRLRLRNRVGTTRRKTAAPKVDRRAGVRAAAGSALRCHATTASRRRINHPRPPAPRPNAEDMTR